MSNIKLFESKQIRTIWNETDQKWYFVITDVVQVLTDTPNPSDYIKKMRKRDEQLSEGWGQIVTPLSMDTAGGLVISQWSLVRRIQLLKVKQY